MRVNFLYLLNLLISTKMSTKQKIKWYHWLVWILYGIALALLIYGIIKNLFL